MTNKADFEIRSYKFNPEISNVFQDLSYAIKLWPVVYILSHKSSQEAYVGETTDAIARMIAHLRSKSKNKLSSLHLITSDQFNKSATLDIESNLIKYMSGDGRFKLLNGNIGLA